MAHAKFGRKLGTAKAVKDSLKTGSGSSPLRFVPKEGSSITVRFIEEPEEWVNYIEVYDPTIKRGYPYPDDPRMPGYDDELRKTSRYVANAVDVESDKVIALQMPKTLVNQLVGRYEKNGTVTDRDYELFRQGTGLETEYHAQSEAPSKKKLSKYEALDLLQLLEDAYNAVWGTDEDDDDDEEAEEIIPKSRKRRAQAEEAEEVEEAEEYDDDDDEDEGDDDPFDDWYDEDDLGEMKISELRQVLRGFDGTPVKGMTKEDLVSAILDAQEEMLDD